MSPAPISFSACGRPPPPLKTTPDPFSPPIILRQSSAANPAIKAVVDTAGPAPDLSNYAVPPANFSGLDFFPRPSDIHDPWAGQRFDRLQQRLNVIGAHQAQWDRSIEAYAARLSAAAEKAGLSAEDKYGDTIRVTRENR